MISIDFGAFFPDSRGNRLEDYQVTAVKKSTRERLYLRGPKEIAKQASWVLDRLERNPKSLPLRERDRGEWTHRIEFDGPLPERLAETLSALQTVLTLA